MSVSLDHQSSFMARRRISSSTAISQSGGMQVVVGGGQSRISTGFYQGRAPSVYGGAGGYGTRISQSTSVFSSGYDSNFSVDINEKGTMQNLNDRLASYLEQVRSLDSANRKLELQIKEFYEKRCPTVSKDYTSYFAIIADLRAKIALRHSENHRINLEIDTNRLAMDDYKMKFEAELNMRMMVEADVFRLRGIRDALTLSISDIEMQVEGLKQDLAYLKSNHEEEMQLLRIQQSGTVNVEVDSAASVDLIKVLEEMRVQYEAVVLKNKQEVEKWYQLKIDSLQTEILICTKDVKSFYTQLSELKRTYQSMEINRQSIYTEIQCLYQSLEEAKNRHSVQLSQLQLTINTLQVELQQLIDSLNHQKSEYNVLLDIKMRLEMEIAEYRRLLDGGLYERREIEKKTVIISKVEQVEEHKPHIERRVKTIVEEIIDGKVVSSSVDTQVEDIQ